MKHKDFVIGKDFECGGNMWRCTDIGTRVIVAIGLRSGTDESWYNGPPYAILEHVFDENDMEGCHEKP